MQKKKFICWDCGGVVDPSSNYDGWGEGVQPGCKNCKKKFEKKEITYEEGLACSNIEFMFKNFKKKNNKEVNMKNIKNKKIKNNKEKEIKKNKEEKMKSKYKVNKGYNEWLEKKEAEEKKVCYQGKLIEQIMEKDPIEISLHIEFKRSFIEEIIGRKAGSAEEGLTEEEKMEKGDNLIEDCYEITEWVLDKIDNLLEIDGCGNFSYVEFDTVEMDGYYTTLHQLDFDKLRNKLAELLEIEGIEYIQICLNGNKEAGDFIEDKEEK